MEKAVIVEDMIRKVKRTKKELEDMETELYRLKAQMLEEEEMDEEEARRIIKEAEELYKKGKGLSIEEFERELGL